MRCWDLAAGKLVRRFDGQPGEVRRASVSPDGKLLLVDAGGSVRLWELSTGKELKRFAGAGPAAATLTADGKRVIGPHAGDPASTLAVWDLATGRELRVFKGHRGPVACFAVSADGRRLLSGGTNGDMGLWELPK